jgi:hypothetical protein
MKNKKFVSILGLAIVLSLLLAVIPAPAALGAGNLYLDINSGAVGDTVTVTGDSFTPSNATYDRYAEVYFAKDNKAVNARIGTDVRTFNLVAESTAPIDDTGYFDAQFAVPSTLTDGSIAATVTTGTYYVYITITSITISTGAISASTIIQAREVFIVDTAASGTLNPLSPTSGPAGTDVTISGTGFDPTTVIIFKFDTTTLTRKSGSSSTTSTGTFSSVITIPDGATAGAHAISVTVGAATVTSTFTVTAAAAALNALVPVTGAAGSDVTVSGSGFLASYPIIFKVDTTTVTPKSGDSTTTTGGAFSSVITIPPNTLTGIHNIYVTVGTVTLSAPYTVIIVASLDSLAPSRGLAGIDITVAGNHFTASSPIVIKFDNNTLTPKSGDVNTTSTGIFSCIITIPATATVGDHTVSVTVGNDTVNATFNVTGTPTTTTTTTTTSTTTTTTSTTTSPPPPTSKILLTAGTHAAGATIQLIAMGFTPGLPVTFTFDTTRMGEVPATADGFAPISYTIPAGTSGNHTITASDGLKSATLAFPVESTPPPIPQPAKPGQNAKVKSPVTFGWAAVTDESLPVTYDLQISSDPNFVSGSLLLDKTKLSTIEYTLTAEELARLSNGAINYYWRERSVDGAMNVSSWSPAVTFTVSQPFKFTGTPMYITFAVIGVVLFFAGFLLGRRMALSY